MKLNMENAYVRFFVDGADLNNGCSVVRRICIRSLTAICAVAFGLFVLTVACFILAGTMLYLFAPWFNTIDVDLSLSYLGNSWWAESLRMGAVFGLIIMALAAVFGMIFGLVTGIFRLKNAEYPTLAKAFQPITDVSHVVGEAVMAFGHKFCPKIEVLWPKALTDLGLKVGSKISRTYEELGEEDRAIVWTVTGITFTKDKERVKIDVTRTVTFDDGSSWQPSYYILYTIDGDFFDEPFKIIDEVPVEEESSPA